MSIIIAGAGSVGLLLGSYLSQSGIEVTMFVRRDEQARLIRQQGIERVNGDGTTSVASVQATSDITQLPAAQLWIVAVKFKDLQDVLHQMKINHVTAPVLFVQNGIGHYALAHNTDLPHLAFATVEHGALRTDDRTVLHNGTGMLTIGAGRGDQASFNVIKEAHSAYFPVKHHDDGEYVLMRKVLINCMINPLTAILQVRNGELLTNVYCRELLNGLYDELMVAFPTMRADLPLEAVEAVCDNTAKNHSSMLMDRLSGRQMEIETIVTAVIERAYAAKKSLPILATLEQMLYVLNGKEDA